MSAIQPDLMDYLRQLGEAPCTLHLSPSAAAATEGQRGRGAEAPAAPVQDLQLTHEEVQLVIRSRRCTHRLTCQLATVESMAAAIARAPAGRERFALVQRLEKVAAGLRTQAARFTAGKRLLSATAAGDALVREYNIRLRQAVRQVEGGMQP